MPFRVYSLGVIIAQTSQNNCGYACSLIANRTDNDALASLIGVIVTRLSAILLVLGIAFLVVRAIRRNGPRAERAWVKRRIAEAERLHHEGESEDQRIAHNLHVERTKQRAHTMQLVATSVLAGLIWLIAGLIALEQFGLNLAPLLAGAGVVGIAIGFGAQKLVQDFLAGVFIVIEDQYGVGDVVDLGDARGTVEQVNLRSTRLRDLEGVVWYVPNGQILRVGNLSQLWSKAVLDISVGYTTDLAEAERIMMDQAEDMWNERNGGATIIERPAFLGIERFEADGVVLRLVIKTEPTEQWAAARELRKRIKLGLDSAGIDIPYPQRTVHLVPD